MTDEECFFKLFEIAFRELIKANQTCPTLSIVTPLQLSLRAGEYADHGLDAVKERYPSPIAPSRAVSTKRRRDR